MTGGLRVRPARPGDADRLRELHRAALRDAGTDPDDVPGTDDLDGVGARYRDAGGAFLVGECGGQVVAMGGYRPADRGDGSGTAELLRMRVAPAHQGRGFGRHLLAELERRAREAGFERAVLETAARQGAVGFYQAAGYRETGRRRWRGYDLVTLEKEL